MMLPHALGVCAGMPHYWIWGAKPSFNDLSFNPCNGHYLRKLMIPALNRFEPSASYLRFAQRVEFLWQCSLSLVE